MKLGFALPVAGSWATPSNQVVVARRAEELGYHSLWTVQRLLYPTEPRNDYPSAPATVRRAATLADGYIGGNVPLARVAPLIDQLRRAAQEAGRDPASMRGVSRGSVRLLDEPHPGDDRRPLWGTLDQVVEDIARYQEAGLDELFIELNFDPAIAAPDVDPDRSLATALTVLEALAPAIT